MTYDLIWSYGIMMDYRERNVQHLCEKKLSKTIPISVVVVGLSISRNVKRKDAYFGVSPDCISVAYLRRSKGEMRRE